MSSKNADNNNTTRTNGRAKRPLSGRVVPAIPLALGKSRVSKPQQSKTDVEVTNGGSGHQYGRETSDVGESPSAFDQSIGHVLEGMQQQKETEGTTDGTSTLTNHLEKEQSHMPNTIIPLESKVGNDMQPPTPPSMNEGTIPSPTATSSPDTVRKSAERFEIRQIRTDFPPAFIPSSEQHTPQSASSSHYSRPQLPTRPLTRPHHPSFGSIVFGEREIRTSSPVPMQQPQTVPGFASHAVDQNAQRAYVPTYQHAPRPPWASRSEHDPYMSQPTYFSNQHPSQRYPPREVFTPATTAQLNGHNLRSRDGSQSSSAIAFEGQQVGPDMQSPIGPEIFSDEARSAFPDHRSSTFGFLRHNPSHIYSQPPVPPPFQHPEFAANFENAEALRAYLSSHLGVAEFVDCHFHISDKQTGIQHHFPGHKIVLSRSFRLLQLIRDQSLSTSVALPLEFSVTLDSQHLRVPQMLDAIRYLYGGPLPPFDMYRPGEVSIPNEERMRLALRHLAMGIWLQIPAIAQRAADMAASLLHWDTLPQLLTFAVDGGLNNAWTMDDGGVERVSTCSSDDSMGKVEPGGHPLYDPQATYLLHRIIDFTVHTLPSNFYLDASAPQLATCPRLPTVSPSHQSRPSFADPRLSKIRFGEISVDDHQRPSFATTMISSILLSLPFPLLKPLLEHFELTHRLGAETMSSIMRSVIQEREARRQKAFKEHHSMSRDDGSDTHLTYNLYWVESVESSNVHRTGCRLARKRRGVDTPPSSGNESERQR